MWISKAEWEDTQKRIADLEKLVQSLHVNPSDLAESVSRSLQEAFQERRSKCNSNNYIFRIRT